MVSVCTARRIARSIASSVCKKPMASSIASSAPTDIDQLLLDGTNAAHYTTAEWAGFEHLLADRKYTVGTLRTPRAGRCWLRDSTDDYLNRNDSNLKPTGDFTICMWIKVADWNVSDKGLAGAWGGAGFMLLMHGGTLRLYRGTNFVSSSLTLHGAGYNNTWIHLTAVASGTTCTFYVNGSQFGATGTWPVSTQTQVAGPFEVGTYQSSTYGHIAASMRDVRLYGVAKNSTEIAAIFNQASTPGTYDTTGLLAGYWCEEESGTTGYDWSGNGRHLTLTNITQATFHASDTGVTYSDANVRGYRLSGSVYIPAQSSTLAADGNALTVTGKCPQPGYAPQKVATFDGTDDYAGETSTHAMSGLSDFTFCAWVYMTANGNFPMLLSNGNTGFYLDIRFSGTSRLFDFASSNSTGANGNVTALTAISLNTWTFLSATYTASSRTVRLYINASLDNSGTMSAGSGGSPNNITISGPTRIGARFDGYYFQGRLADVRVYNVVKTVGELSTIMTGGIDATGIVRHWPMCEGPGTGNTNTTIYDVSGNGKHLTITNATVSSFWANSTALPCTVANYPLRYGYTVNGSGVIVPALLSGASDAAGNAIGQATGGWASGLQNLNCLPYTNPLGVSVGLETSLDPTADRKTTSSSKRRRRNTSGRYDRFGARSTAMSDASSNAYFGD